VSVNFSKRGFDGEPMGTRPLRARSRLDAHPKTPSQTTAAIHGRVGVHARYSRVPCTSNAVCAVTLALASTERASNIFGVLYCNARGSTKLRLSDPRAYGDLQAEAALGTRIWCRNAQSAEAIRRQSQSLG
jgi:hypothetical protein